MDWMIDGFSRKTSSPRLVTQFINVDDGGATLIHEGDPNCPLWFTVYNADANPVTVRFTQLNDSAEWMRVRLLTNASIVIPGWDANGFGLEVYAADAVADNGFFITTAFPGGFDAPI